MHPAGLHTQHTVQQCCPSKAGTLAVAGPAISIHHSWPQLKESSGGIKGHDCCHWCSGGVGGSANPSPGPVTGGASLGVGPYGKQPPCNGYELYQSSTEECLFASSVLRKGWTVHCKGDLWESPGSPLTGESFPLPAQCFSVNVCKPNAFHKV